MNLSRRNLIKAIGTAICLGSMPKFIPALIPEAEDDDLMSPAEFKKELERQMRSMDLPLDDWIPTTVSETFIGEFPLPFEITNALKGRK